MKNILAAVLLCLGYALVIAAKPSFALKYDLVPPSGDLQRGQQIQFTINIDTEGTSVSSTQIGMTYNTQYLQYVSTVPGNAMTNVSVSQPDTGKLLFSGSNPSGYSGSDVFAYVNFTIIAGSPGSTELCVLWAPSPTAAPTTVTGTTPVPTALPVTGNVERTAAGGIVGGVFLAAALSFYLLSHRHHYHVKRHGKKLSNQS